MTIGLRVIFDLMEVVTLVIQLYIPIIIKKKHNHPQVDAPPKKRGKTGR